ncbi:MAG TPA: hypothetical protein VFP58_03425 [Candidatus Eisenbacteria bacterium]|nr:hypothetical protein [Candidatus Eisenbacteria bacterium]
MRPWALVLAGSILLGSFLGAAAPATWPFRWTDGLLLGSALYAAALRRYVDRREAEAACVTGGETASPSARIRSMIPGLLLRTALFALLVSVQAALCFDVLPNADVRRGFVVLSAYVVMLALIDTGMTRREAPRGSPHAGASEASRPPCR